MRIITKTRLPFYIYAVVFSSLSIITGVLWDISWHISIGRDGLFAPPHLAIYLGAVIAGISSGYHVLRLSFAGKAGERESSMNFWTIFYGSLGSLYCIWGAFMMITSAPFDDWWHNTFGLDVKILSPPHTVLALGIIAVQFGAMITVIAIRNRLTEISPATKRILNFSFILSSAIMLAMVFTMASEDLTRRDMHSSIFYQICAVLFPLFLIAMSKVSSGKWGATYTTLMYTLLLGLAVWVFPLFSAEPKLGPVLNHITHFQSLDFPLLIIFPAIATDWIHQRMQKQTDLTNAALTGIVFVLIFLVFQWPFGQFLMHSGARNWFFGTEGWSFADDPNFKYRYAFDPARVDSPGVLARGIGVAILLAIASSWLGLRWGSWMKAVKR